jgi:predicted nucleic acid-binding protein
MIFVDTSALIAYLDAGDDFNEKAVEYYLNLLKNDCMLITTNYIILEAIIILKKRFGLEAVSSFNNNITPSLKIYWIDEEIHEVGVNNLVMVNRKKVSLVDYTSFEVMKRLNIEKAFSFDNHFKSFGFKLV